MVKIKKESVSKSSYSGFLWLNDIEQFFFSRKAAKLAKENDDKDRQYSIVNIQ